MACPHRHGQPIESYRTNTYEEKQNTARCKAQTYLCLHYFHLPSCCYFNKSIAKASSKLIFYLLCLTLNQIQTNFLFLFLKLNSNKLIILFISSTNANRLNSNSYHFKQMRKCIILNSKSMKQCN